MRKRRAFFITATVIILTFIAVIGLPLTPWAQDAGAPPGPPGPAAGPPAGPGGPGGAPTPGGAPGGAPAADNPLDMPKATDSYPSIPVFPAANAAADHLSSPQSTVAYKQFSDTLRAWRDAENYEVLAMVGLAKSAKDKQTFTGMQVYDNNLKQGIEQRRKAASLASSASGISGMPAVASHNSSRAAVDASGAPWQGRFMISSTSLEPVAKAK